MALKWIALGALVAGCMGTAQAEEGDFFPLEVGNRWVFQKYDVRYPDTLRLEETVSTEVIGQVQFQERSYFVVRQGWNGFLPETLYLRKEGAQVFRYLEQPDTVAYGTPAQEWDRPAREDLIPLDLDQTDWLVYDFEASQGTFWDVLLPDHLSFVSIWWVLVNARWPGDTDPPPNWECCWYAPFQVAPSQRFFRFFATSFAAEWDEVFEVGVGPIYITNLTDDVEAWNFGLLKEAHIGGQIITRDWPTSVEQTSWGQVKASPGDRPMPASRVYKGQSIIEQPQDKTALQFPSPHSRADFTKTTESCVILGAD
ncbi:MAG: hypothetical protein OXE49_20050 [Gemmatimonadetes bacterium]|nr:hypothetical protein [Gemmatimonadota bacterium]